MIEESPATKTATHSSGQWSRFNLSRESHPNLKPDAQFSRSFSTIEAVPAKPGDSTVSTLVPPSDCLRKTGYGKTVVLLSGHPFQSQRRAGFHWLAESLWEQGWTVIFITTGVSLLSTLKRHPSRMNLLNGIPHNHLVWHRERLASFLWHTPWHPVKLKFSWLNRCLTPLFKCYGQLPLYGMKQVLRSADVVIFESTSSLLLFDRINRLNPIAKKVYRVSDDLRCLSVHPCLLAQEQALAGKFDLISLPSEHLHSIFPPLASVQYQPHGIPIELFDREYPNPYSQSKRINAVSVGNMLFDHQALEYASRIYPEVDFHIIGAVESNLKRDNVYFYGEMAFEEMIPYIQWASLGLALYRLDQGIPRYLSQSSNKLIQYSYCRLPIVAPISVCEDREHAFGYDNNQLNTLFSAISQALNYDRSRISKQQIPSWQNLAMAILQQVNAVHL